MENVRQLLVEDITAGITAAQQAGVWPADLKVPVITVVRAPKPDLGDYASPIALALSKLVKQKPLDIVATIAEYMPKKEYIGKLESAAPGFLNIRLNPGWLTSRLDNVITEDLHSDMNLGQGQQLNFEFISANPTGPLTFGNVRTAFSVDSLANVLEFAGFNVTREYYINDAGAQIKKLGQSVLRRILQAQGEQVEFPDELYQGEYIAAIGQQIAEETRETEGKEFEVKDLENTEVITKVSEKAMNLLLAEIKRMIAADLKITFNVWTSEKHIRESGQIEKLLDTLKSKGETYEKDGAIWLKTTKYGMDQDQVLVKQDGEYAYFTPDIVYHQDKYNRGFDQIYTFVGADHAGHAPKLKAAMQALGNDIEKLHIVAAQFLRFVRNGEPVKLSKRAGNVFTPKDLIDEVGYDAARFFMVQHALTTHMDFDLEIAKEKSERNPVYYIQYAYVRLQSILRRAKEEGAINQIGDALELTSHTLLTHQAELQLLKEIYRLPEVIADITTTFEVQALAYYALDLAKAIHVFYRHVPVLSVEQAEMKQSRLQLVLAVRKVLGQTLDLLGITKLDVM